MMMLEATDPIARPLNPAAPRSALSNCRIPLAGLRRGLASNKVPGRVAGLPIWRAARNRYLCKEHEQEREKIRMRYRPSTYVRLLRAMTIGNLNSLLNFMGRILPGGNTVRPFLQRLRGVKIGESVWIGEDVYLDEECPETIEIQDGATIATRCTLIGHTKGSGKIVIEKRAAIGAGSVIAYVAAQTLRIGEGAVVSAGSTVLSDVPPFTLCGPARIKIYGSVTVPFREAGSVEQFRRGVRPLKPKTTAPLQDSKVNGSETA